MFLAYAFINTGGLRIVNTRARFEAAGSKDVALGSGIIVGMFLLFFWIRYYFEHICANCKFLFLPY